MIDKMAREKREAGIHTGADIKHGAVDTIFSEDYSWFEQHNGQGLTIVEQEVAGLAAAVAQAKGMTELYAFFRISDIVGPGGQSFVENESHRPQARTSFYQGDVVIAALEEVLGPFTKSGDKSPERHDAKSGKARKKGEAAWETDKATLYVIQSQLEALYRVDSKLADQLDRQLPKLIAQHRGSSDEEVMKAVLELYAEYGIKSRTERGPLKSDVRIEFAGNALRVRRKGSDAPLSTAHKGNIWTVEFDRPPAETAVVLEFSIDGGKRPR